MFLTINLGAKILPEVLETGEYVCGGTAEINELEPDWVIAFTGRNVGGQPTGIGGFEVNGIASSISYLICTSLEAYNSALRRYQ